MVRIYQYPRCGTCKKALKWLDAHGVEYESIDITLTPPTRRILKRVLVCSELPVRRLFNTSGQLYRQGGYKERLPTMTEVEALSELASLGKLIKRPLLIADEFCLVGFKPAEYENAFG